MENYTFKLKTFVKVILIILFAYYIFDAFYTFIYSIKSYNSASIIGLGILLLLKICFFGVILYAIFAKKKEIYAPLITVLLSYYLMQMFFRIIEGFTNFENFASVSVPLSIFTAIYFLTSSIFAGFIIADLAFKKNFRIVEFVLLLITIISKVVATIIIFSKINYIPEFFRTYLSYILDTVATSLILIVIYAKPLSLAEKEPKVEQKSQDNLWNE